MSSLRSVSRCALMLVVLAFPAVARGQSAIAGVVKDASGGVMPGVTVEASSPALIEKVRSVVSDEQGQYKILDLRPGTYTVTFTLEGFSTTKREGIELPVNFTAQINGEMRVGQLSEMVTVTGEAAIVDVQSAVSQQVLPQKLLDAIPTGGRNIQSVGATLVGVTQSAPDVGGSAGMQQTYLNAHGSDARDNAILVDGIRLNGIEFDGAIQQYYNEGMFAEMAYQTGGIQVDTSSGGVRLNMIPKDGGNVFKGDAFFSATSHNLQGDPRPSDADPRMKAPNALDSMHDFNVSVGGPLKKDKLWFFSSMRHWGVNQEQANSFYPDQSVSQLTAFVPDTSRQVIDNNLIKSFMTRLTYQVSPKNKLAGYLDRIIKFRGHEQTSGAGSGSMWSEDTFGIRNPKQYYTAEVKWTGTWTSKLLFEAGIGINNESYDSRSWQPGLVETNPIPKWDASTGAYWGAPGTPFIMKRPVRDTAVASLSYVTGSHAFKVGVERSHGFYTQQNSFPNPNVNFIERFNAGKPQQVYIYNTPTEQYDNLNVELGLFMGDTWTFKRVTLTPGLRFEHINGSYSESGIPVSKQTLLLAEGYPERPLFLERTDLPNWNNWSPRIGLAYDVFGNGKTAVKASFSKYMVAYSTGYAAFYNPMVLSTDQRTWTDSNLNNIYDPGIDKLGPSTNKLFGQVFRNPDPDITRPYNLEFTSSVQQQVVKGLSVSFGYFRRWYKDIIYSTNPTLDAAGASAFTAITVANPCLSVTDPLAACGGTAPDTITAYSINPALDGAGTIVDKNSTRDSRVFNGIEAQFMARVKGGTFFGGTSVSKQVSNNCDLPLTISSAFSAASNPNFTIFCDQTQYDIPFRTQVKVGGAYDLPASVSVSGTFQSYPGALNSGTGNAATSWLPVTLAATSASVPGLGRAENIPMINPGSKYYPRWNQLDLRVAWKLPVGRYGSLQLQADLFNALNAHQVTTASSTFGSALNTPTAILASRLLSLGAQWHF